MNPLHFCLHSPFCCLLNSFHQPRLFNLIYISCSKSIFVPTYWHMALNSKRLLTVVTSNTSLLSPLLIPLGFAPFLHIIGNPFLLHRRMHRSSVVIPLDLPLIFCLSKWALSWNSIIFWSFQPTLIWDSFLNFVL